MRVYSIYDELAEEFGPLFESKNDQVALRNFKQLLVSKNLSSGGDLKLFCVGDFHDGRMHLIGDKPIEILVPKMMEVFNEKSK